MQPRETCGAACSPELTGPLCLISSLTTVVCSEREIAPPINRKMN